MEYITPYYTNRELDSLFVEDSPTGVTGSINATSLGLVAPSGLNSISWGNRNLVSGTQQNLNWSGGIGFFGTAGVSKPSGSNIVSSVTSLGLASYTALTGSVLPNLIFSATGITYTAPTASQNIASSITQSGIVTTFSAAPGSNFVNLITASGLAASYTAPTSTNFYTNLNYLGVVSVNQVTGNNVFNAMASAVGGVATKPSYNSPFVAARELGFLSDNNELWSASPLRAPSVTVSNVVSMFSDFPTIVAPAKAATLGVLPWSDATFSTTVSLHFGLVPSYGGVVTRLASFGGTVSSSVLTWWNPASFGKSTAGSGGIISSINVITASAISFGHNIGGLCFVGLPWGRYQTPREIQAQLNASDPIAILFGLETSVPFTASVCRGSDFAVSALCRGLVFRVKDITTTAAVIECINASTADVNQSTAPFRILAF